MKNIAKNAFANATYLTVKFLGLAVGGLERVFKEAVSNSEQADCLDNGAVYEPVFSPNDFESIEGRSSKWAHACYNWVMSL